MTATFAGILEGFAILAVTEGFDPTSLGGLIDRYGLPIAILAGFAWLVLTRRFVTGNELAYVEARRVEEREGRLAAEATTRVLAAAFEKIGGSIEQIADTVTDAVEQALEADRKDRKAAL